MKLVSLYSNLDDIFPRIDFRDGINVIFGQVKEENVKKDSHNLGKTFLISVIDFCLLGGFDKSHPFKAKHELFNGFIFYLEIQANSGQRFVIRRGVEKPTKIFIHTTLKQDYTSLIALPDSDWSYSSLSLDKARETVDGLLNLEDIRPFDYRKGLSHVMRRQADYIDEFRTSKFTAGKDAYWKPYILRILGFDEKILDKKYDIDSEINNTKDTLKVYERDAGYKSEEYDEIKGRYEILTERIRIMKLEFRDFDFKDLDAFVSNEMVNEVEREISRWNETKYRAEASIRDIEASLSKPFNFDLTRISRIYEEARIAFAGALEKSFEDLVEFNRKLSDSRNQHLVTQLQLEISNKETAVSKIEELTAKRQDLVSMLLETQTMEKYKLSQERIIDHEKEAASLSSRLEVLDKAAAVSKDISTLQKKKITYIDDVTTEIRKSNALYSLIRRNFTNFTEDVLDTTAILTVNVNQEGNPEFKVITVDDKRETNEGMGTSYKKILCACFDLSVVSAHSQGSFYRYIYHDGIFEGLDNRKKINLLGKIRETCQKNSLQYILTIIDTDLPRDLSDNKLLFSDDEIVRKLDDTGEQGQLFRMAKF